MKAEEHFFQTIPLPDNLKRNREKPFISKSAVKSDPEIAKMPETLIPSEPKTEQKRSPPPVKMSYVSILKRPAVPAADPTVGAHAVCRNPFIISIPI